VDIETRDLFAGHQPWAAEPVRRLSEQQWHDAFRAAGYTRAEAQPFIDIIASRLAEARTA
jgi:hypothetical protein